MSKLIKREDAIKATWHEPSYTDAYNVLTEVRDRIEALPTVDAVPVVRCGDCRWACLAPQRQTATCMKKRLPFTHDYEWFCADGERKDGERRTE